MKTYLVPLLIGCVIGVIDIMPMIKNKLDQYSIASAFVFHLFMPIVVFNLSLEIIWWLRGGLVYLICAVPVVILIAKEDQKAAPIVAVTSVVMGTIVGVLAHFIL